MIITLTIPGLAAQKKWQKIMDGCYVENRWDDGDSFHIRWGSNLFILRLYFIDAPECNFSIPDRNREQSDYFGVDSDEIIKEGLTARAAVQFLLRKPFEIYTRWAIAPGRSTEHRYYGLVYVGGQSLIEILLSQGLARVKGKTVQLPDGKKSKVYLKELMVLEKKAKKDRKGIWAKSNLRSRS